MCIWWARIWQAICRQAGRLAIRQLEQTHFLMWFADTKAMKMPCAPRTHRAQFIFHFCDFEGQWNFIFDFVFASAAFFCSALKSHTMRVCLTGWQISHFDRRKQRHFLITQMTTTSRQRNTLTHSLERTTEDKIKRNEAHWRMNERTKRTREWTNKGLSQHVHNHKSFYCPSLFREPLSYSAFPHMRLNFNRNL